MSPIRKCLRRYSPALLGAILIAGCSSGGTDNSNPGTIALALNPTTGTATQGGQTTVGATLTRGGGFTGTVNLTVTGAPAGVTATVSNVVTTGTTTTATVTIDVAESTPTSFYQLVVHGTGTGVTEAIANYGLAVTAFPAVSLALSAPALTAVQGSATAVTTVTLTRTNFTGDVTLSVDNLPTGVTAAFAPANPQSGNSSVLTLTITADAPVGPITTLAVRATGTGITAATTPLSLTITAPAPDYQLSLTNAALSIVQGASAPTTVNIARTNFTGPVTLTTTGNPQPEGVTITFNPTSPTTANSTVATVAVDAGVTPGVYNLSINGAGTPGNRATPLVLTVTAGVPVGNFSLSTTPTPSVVVPQGGAGVPVTVNINHTGGNISLVTLSTTAVPPLPAGLTLSPFPINPTGQPSSTFTITASGAVPVGAYQIVIHGNMQNLAEQTVNLTINVTGPSGSGNVTVDFTGCAAANTPIWAAFQNGAFTAPWQVVTPVGAVYSFTIDAGKGGFTYVTQGTGSTNQVIVQYMSQTEFTAGTLRLCGSVPTGRTLTGLVNGLPTGFVASVSFGNAFGFAAAVLPNFTLNNAANGAHDLIVYAHPSFVVAASDRMGIYRQLNPGSAFAPVDIGADAESFTPQVATITLTGTPFIGETFTQGMSYYSGPTCDVASLYNGMTFSGTSFTAYGARTDHQLTGDRHSLMIAGNDGAGNFRSVWETFHDLTSHAVALPSVIPTMTVNETGTSYSILRAQFPAPAEYNNAYTFHYTQNSAPKSALITATHAYFGSQTIDLKIGQYSSLAGWLNGYAPATGQSASTTVTASGGSLAGGFCSAANNRFVTVSVVSTF